MKRYLLLLIPVCLAGALAWADDPAPSPAVERAERLQRNLGLISALVDGSLSLAAEDDPLRRAEHCNTIANHFAKEINEATERRNVPRVLELGRHLHQLLEVGVGSNLSRARGGIPPGSAEEKKLLELRQGAAQLVGELEDQLQQAVTGDPQAENQAEMEKALEEMQVGRYRVEGTLKTSSKPRDKSKSGKVP
jgi:hypothetical protein